MRGWNGDLEEGEVGDAAGDGVGEGGAGVEGVGEAEEVGGLALPLGLQEVEEVAAGGLGEGEVEEEAPLVPRRPEQVPRALRRYVLSHR